MVSSVGFGSELLDDVNSHLGVVQNVSYSALDLFPLAIKHVFDTRLVQSLCCPILHTLS